MNKSCPHCDSPLVNLTSQRLRICSGCNREFSWKLDAGQKPLLGNNRQDRGRNEA